MLRSFKRSANTALRRLGYEFVRYPDPSLFGTHLRDLLTLYRINCVLDVGACRGKYGRLLRGIGYQGRIVSFEPVLANFEALVDGSRDDASWRAERLALGSESGRRAINVTGHPGMCSILQPSDFALAYYRLEAEVRSVEEVTMTRLDLVFDDAVAGLPDPRVYLKTDTQGFDLEVLQGAAGCLDRVVAVQTEISVKPLYENTHNYLEVISYLESFGFEISGLFPVAVDERDLTALEFDCLMVRPRRLP